MADQLDWGNEANEPAKPKRRVPVWAWFCGGGCLLALITIVVSTFAVGSCVKDMQDPDKQWGELEKVVRISTRPEGEIFGMKVPFQDLRVITIQMGMTKADFMIAGGQQGDELRTQFLDPDATFSMGPMLGNMGRHEPEEVVLEVQGREVRGMRFITQPRGDAPAESEPTGEDPAAEEPTGEITPGEAFRLATRTSVLALDLSREGTGKTVILQYSHMGTLDRIEDQEVLDFLAHFDLSEGQ